MNDFVNLNAEYAVIGSILLNEKILDSLTLESAHFATEVNQTVFNTMRQLRRVGTRIDPITLTAAANDADVTDQYLREVMNMTTHAANAPHYAEILRDCARRRGIRDVAMAALESVNEGSMSPEDIAAATMLSLEAITMDGVEAEIITSAEQMEGFRAYRQKFADNPTAMYVPTGISAIDNILGGGMVREGLYILAARPGVGKTTLALNIAEQVARRGESVLFLSLEMSTDQIAAKRISRVSGVSGGKLLMDKLEDGEESAMEHAIDRLKKLPLSINRRDGVSVSQISGMARKVKGLRLVIVDYLGLIRPSGKRKSRYEEITETSGELKAMARRLGVPVLCLAQLNRESMARGVKNPRPKISELRDSGAIEQDADGVILLYNADYGEQTRSDYGELEAIIAKNRHGRTDTAKLGWNGAQSKVVGRETRYG